MSVLNDFNEGLCKNTVKGLSKKDVTLLETQTCKPPQDLPNFLNKPFDGGE